MINDFITRLTQQLTNFRRVQHAWDTQPFEDVDAADMPICLAFVGSEDSEQSQQDSCGVRQKNNRTLVVFTICKSDEIEQRRDEVLAAALGWQAGPQWYPLQHSSGETRKLNGQYIWWVDTFTTWRNISGG